MAGPAWSRARLILLLGVLALPLAAGCAPAATEPSAGQPQTAQSALGSIAYVDGAGCIQHVDLDRPGEAPASFCPPSLRGVTGVAWLDSARIAYLTPESERIGWRAYNILTGEDAPLPPGEAPRVAHAGPVQPYSILGDFFDVGPWAPSLRCAVGSRRELLLPGAATGDRALPVLLSWSPDGQWALVEHTRDRTLSILHRDGTQAREVAPESRGLASWFMPEAGAMPHMDFTCGLPTEATFRCVPVLREPAPLGPGSADMLFSWLSCTGATGYELVIAAAGSDEVLARYITGITAYRVPGDLLDAAAGRQLRWRVRPVVGVERGAWSDWGLVSTGVGPPQ